MVSRWGVENVGRPVDAPKHGVRAHLRATSQWAAKDFILAGPIIAHMTGRRDDPGNPSGFECSMPPGSVGIAERMEDRQAAMTESAGSILSAGPRSVSSRHLLTCCRT